MAKITDDEWEKLEAGFDTRQLLDVIDDVDVLRSALNDDGHQPPEIRNRILTLLRQTTQAPPGACTGPSMSRPCYRRAGGGGYGGPAGGKRRPGR